MLSRLIAAAIVVTLLCEHCIADIRTNGRLGDDNPTLIYNAATGELTLNGDGGEIELLEINAAQEFFIGERPDVIKPPFGLFTPKKIRIVEPSGLERIAFGKILKPGIELQTLGKVLSGKAHAGSRGTIELDLMLATAETQAANKTAIPQREKPSDAGKESDSDLDETSEPEVVRRALVYVYSVELDRKSFIKLLRMKKRSEFEAWLHGGKKNSAKLHDQAQFVTTDGKNVNVSITSTPDRQTGRQYEASRTITTSNLQCTSQLHADTAKLNVSYRSSTQHMSPRSRATRRDRSTNERTGEIDVKYGELTILFGTVNDRVSATIVGVESLPPLPE